MYSTMQAVVKMLAGTTGWADLEALKDANIKATGFFKAQSNLDHAEALLQSEEAALSPHLIRLESVYRKMQEILRFNIAQEQQNEENIEAIIGTLDDIESAKTNVLARIFALESRKEAMRIKMDAKLAELLQILQARCNFVEETEELPIAKLAENMVPADLDEIESDCVRFDEFLTEQAGMGDPDTEIDEYENDVASMERDLAYCKQRHRQLVSGEGEPESPDECTYLESQLQDICHELALRGIPTENGSVMMPYFDAGRESACSAYTMPLQPVQLEQPEIDEMIQLKLFDNADFEKLTADGGEREPLSQAEIDYYFDKLDARVLAWMDCFDESMDADIPSSPLVLDNGLDGLLDQPSDSVSCTLQPAQFSEYEQVVAKARLQAWAFQLARDCDDTFQRVSIESPYIALPQNSDV